jgi:hypothetical protein
LALKELQQYKRKGNDRPLKEQQHLLYVKTIISRFLASTIGEPLDRYCRNGDIDIGLPLSYYEIIELNDRQVAK